MIAIKPSPPASPGLTALEPFLPVLLTSGPMFMYIGLSGLADIPRALNSFYLLEHLFALAGVLGLTIGLSLLLVRQVKIMRRLDALEKQKQSDG